MDSHLEELSGFLDTSPPGKIISVTWLNHHSLASAMRANCRLESFSIVGIDGVFLKRLSGSTIPRSSADLFLPHYFQNRQVKVGVIGGPVEGLEARRKEFLRRFPHLSCEFFLDGYTAYDPSALISRINEFSVDVLVIGMGTPFQENRATDLLDNSESIQRKLIVFTCGAWLEQLLFKSYYPWWAYKLRLNWLVRLVRNPTKLWKRYFVESFKVLLTRRMKIKYLKTLPGYLAMQEIS